ncbi:3'(2'),5'-bisphosphate nucleotidase CysQ [Calothrix sp. PCC 6303]|uniref:3'(2'),5'-bisphosphate nucleotidase CysQ family protein n=1 Tax=Calothrix sp. PCC 6303 TaxID=1170562 RepID=UPI0002A023FC|nr:inositol monophosphatase family protein [Calothrix sp. PCC 6303]AFZ02154.1 inositol monophosphatase [Calothrix sp. PCC 6303]
MQNLQQILQIARPITWEAAKILKSYYQKTQLDIEYKGEDPVTAADIAVSNYLIQQLQSQLKNQDFGYVSEENYQQQQLTQEYVWIIDPLDGTRDFIDKTGEYAIHIALVKNHRPVLALIAIPETDKIYYATLNGGTFVETSDGKIQKIEISTSQKIENLIVLVSRFHRTEKLEYLLKNLPCQNHKSVGSIGCKIVNMIEHQADVYISISGKSAPKDWDIAAPELILTEAGGKYTHLDLTPLQYNTGDVSQWGGLLASSGEFHDILCRESQKILLDWEKLENPQT